MQDAAGQVLATHSISAGLDYPGVGPEHSALRDSGRVEYLAATDSDALAAFHELCLLEGIIPALESSHALHVAAAIAADRATDEVVLVCLSGRGDKDVDTVREHDSA
jgi:tryptophan synthase beta chain